MRTSASDSSGSASRPHTSNSRVLIIDDEPMMGTTLRMALADDHEVTIVDSGEEARALLERDTGFDVIICDLMMPDYSGMELHGWLSDRAPELAQRMVFMTGGAYTESARRFLDAVGNPSIQKPFDVEELLDLVARMQSTSN